MLQCAKCTKSLAKKSKSEYHFRNDQHYCKSCYRSLFSSSRKRSSEVLDLANSEMHPERSFESLNDLASDSQGCRNSTIHMQVMRGHLSHKKCIFNCSPNQKTDLQRLSREECIEVYVQREIYISYGARACLDHWRDGDLQVPENFETSHSGIQLSSNDVTELLQAMRKKIINERKTAESFLAMEETTLKFETGLNKMQFKHILSFLPDELRVRERDLAVGIYLSRLKRGSTFEELANRWKITRKTVSKYCSLVREHLNADFLNTYLGLNVSREEMLYHQNTVTTRLHAVTGDTVILVFDGTYIFIEKSSNFHFQKLSYSGHKKKNLIKPFMVVYPDGYIGDVWGPYPGNKSDATIMIDGLNGGKVTTLKPGDIFLVDRGFRDSLKSIEEKGFVAKMPCFSDTPRSSLTTEQANASRMVTKSRYIVEYVNGRIKNFFQLFNSTVRNTILLTIFDDFKIACAIYNCIFTAITNKTSDLIINRMLQQVSEPNLLADLVVEENINRKTAMFKNIEEMHLERFPKLDLEQLTLYVCGTYQLRLASSYYAEHINEHGDFKVEIAVESSPINYAKYGIVVDRLSYYLLKAKIRSRHSNSDKYFVYLLINTSVQGIKSIIQHYCGCKVGRRVVGCCSHVTVLIWYYGYARHLASIRAPAAHLSQLFQNSDEENITDEESDYD